MTSHNLAIGLPRNCLRFHEHFGRGALGLEVAVLEHEQ